MGIGKQSKKLNGYILLFCISFLLIGYEGVAQKFYLKAGGGYKLQAGKTRFIDADPNGFTRIGPSQEINVDNNGLATIKDISGTFGGGLELDLTGGYIINNYLAVELGIVYLKGDEKTIGQYQDALSTEKATSYLNGVLLSPSLVVDPGFSGINPYVRAGLVLTAAGKLYVDTSVDIPGGGGPGTDIDVNAQTVVEPDFSVGYAGAIGALFPINEKISLFGEMEFRNFTIRAKEGEIEEFSTVAISGGTSTPVQGQQLENLPVSSKRFIFSDSYQASLVTEPPTNEPRTIPVQYVNAGSMGVNFGVYMKF